MQIVWVEIMPNTKSGVIWIQIVCHSDGTPERRFLKNIANSLPVNGNLCYLLITFANRLYPDQTQKHVWPGLDPNFLTLLVFL